jgi:tetratricopeptide (TPR) repeat protein
VRVVVSEAALETLLTYNDQSPEHAHRVRSLFGALEEEGHDREVLKLSGAPRPIWTQPLDGNTVIYFTHGRGASVPELRIALVGPPPSDPRADLKRLLYAAGDVPYHEIPQSIRMEEQQTVAVRPQLPDRLLEAGASLQSYLAPSDDNLLDALAEDSEDADDLHGRRYRILTGLRSAQELPIRLSPQQERLLGSPLPLLFQGVAGSGKTTVVARFAHRQLVGAGVTPSVLVVAYTEELREFTRSVLNSLNDLESVESSPQVRTWRELCEDLATHAGIAPIAWAPQDFFLEQLHLHTGASARVAKTRHLAYEIQEFIRSTLKGEAIDPSDPPPHRRKVLTMDSTPVDGQIDRGALYDLAQDYQHALAVRGLSDDSDAARQLLAYIDLLPKYDYVMVDEVQDYTLVQLLLLARMCRRMEGLLFAGDVDQILHPSHFTWQRVRQAIWKAWYNPPPDPVTIDYNYRNPQPITDLANTLLELRSKQLGMPRPNPGLSNQALTPRPIRLVLPKTQLDALVVELASKIGSLAVIRKDQPDDIVIGGITLERSFTPRLVKGLEFNVVCLVDFNEDYKHLAAKAKDQSHSQRRLHFNEVYVSVTRTRAQLLLLDRRALRTGLWESPDVRPLIDDAESAAALLRLVAARFENRTRQDWELDAIEFESQHAYAAAGECWERSGRPDRAAGNYEQAGRLEKALDIYRSVEDFEAGTRIALRLGRRRDAADFLERSGQLGRAAELWAEMGKRLEAARLYQRAAEDGLPGGDWKLAGRHYVAAGANKAAASCFERAGDWRGAAEQWLAAGEPGRAAGNYEQAGNWQRAVECWLAAGELLAAAAGQQRLGLVKQAAATRAAYYEQQGQVGEAAEQWLAAGEPGRAAELLERAEDPKRARLMIARRLQAGGQYDAAGVVYALAGRRVKARWMALRSWRSRRGRT